MQFGIAVVLIGAGSGMAFFEWQRFREGNPILVGKSLIQLYWVAYLSLLVLGITFFLSAIIR